MASPRYGLPPTSEGTQSVRITDTCTYHTMSLAAYKFVRTKGSSGKQFLLASYSLELLMRLIVSVALYVGKGDGAALGETVGSGEGAAVGAVGCAVGSRVGGANPPAGTGANVGCGLGLAVGCGLVPDSV
jgi:hypothetical protein